MKHAVVLFAVAFLALSIAGPAMGPANGVAWGVSVIDDDQETPPSPPKGVSPANPDIKPPNLDEWFCCQCGAANAYPKRQYMKRFHGPMLGSRAGGGASWGACRGDGPGRRGYCGTPGERGGRGFHGRGHGQMVAAERIVKFSAELDLTDKQIATLETLSYETKKKLIDFHADIEKERLEVRNRLRSGSEDLTQIKRHLSAVAKAQVAIKEAKIANLFETRKVLTDEQKKLVREKHPRLGMIFD